MTITVVVVCLGVIAIGLSYSKRDDETVKKIAEEVSAKVSKAK